MTGGKRALRPDSGPPQPGRHRAVKPRYGRIVVVALAAVVTLVAVIGGFGWLPHGRAPAAAAVSGGLPSGGGGVSPSSLPSTASSASSSAPADRPAGNLAPVAGRKVVAPTALPAASGHGRRIVFSQSEQRVWLVGTSDKVQRTYLVSGSVTDNLHPGTYAVYSRSRWAVGVDDSGTMQYFVRFTHGPTGAAIGFHTLPVKDGKPLETVAGLGTPRSHGCIRQATPDAIALWNFAPIGTKVVVV